jgi:hypothetical protein
MLMRPLSNTVLWDCNALCSIVILNKCRVLIACIITLMDLIWKKTEAFFFKKKCIHVCVAPGISKSMTVIPFLLG